MNKIPIYKAEYGVEGLAEKIQSSASVMYYSPATTHALSERSIATLQSAMADKKLAKLANDMYTTKSILVSTVWNLNDDIFLPEPTWAARNSPVHKPTNLGHNEHELVGNIIETWAINKEGGLIPDSSLIDDLPPTFHICDASVIWTAYSDDKLIERTEALINSIEAGSMYVSMECLFPNFDYATVAGDSFNIIPRDKSTAFLTKHLRAYGGEGHYEGNKLGRVLRGFAFSGKGYVEEPGNPESIIFEEGHKFDFSKASLENPFDGTSGVYISCKGEGPSNQDLKSGDDDHMANEMNDVLTGRLTAAEASVANKDKTIAAKEDVIVELRKEMSESVVASVKEENKDLQSRVEAAMKDVEAKEEAATAAEAKIVELTQSLEEANTAKADLEKKVAEAEAQKTVATRVSALVDGGIEKVEAEATVAKFENLDEVQFKVVADTLIEAKAAGFPFNKDEDKDKDKDKDKKKGKDEKAKSEVDDETKDGAAAGATEEVLDNAKANKEGGEGSADTSETEEREASRASLGKSIATLIKNRS
jgi:hypothetical protein